MIIFTEAPKTKKGEKIAKHFDVPDSVQAKLRDADVRKKMKKSCFLLPDERKFPICNPNTGKIDCRLIKAAMSRAAGFNKGKKKYPGIFRKAQELYKKHCASKESFNLDYEAIADSVFFEYIVADYEDRGVTLEQYMEAVLGEDYARLVDQKVMLEKDVRQFSQTLKQWLANRDKIPASYFLDPKNKKYPVKGPDGKYNCSLILHARIRAKQHNHPTIAAKADALYKKYCEKKK